MDISFIKYYKWTISPFFVKIVLLVGGRLKTFIKGKYKKSIYESGNGYIIGLFKLHETDNEVMQEYLNKTITFTGNFHELIIDDDYIFYGEEIEHPKYGLQFNVLEYERLKPSDKIGIIEFLSSDLFPGIGEKLAEKIVDVLGENTLDLILEKKENLMLVPKLSQNKANLIYDNLTKYEASHKTIVYLNDLGFTMQDALKIYNKYKENTINNIECNIFNVIDDIDDISFLRIDEIRKRLNVSDDDTNRIKACIIYIMKTETYTNGDTYFLSNELLVKVIKYLKFNIPLEEFNIYLEELQIETKIIVEDNKYYLTEIYDAEITILNRINELKAISKSTYKKIDSYIEELEKVNNIVYNDKQKEAIIKALENNLLIITGGPGTGKTTIIKAIVYLYQKLYKLNNDELEKNLALLAPTGRASKRMSESTLMPATTIHRFLKWNKENNEFGINEYNKDNSKLIIIDEVSMIDINLLSSLFKGLTRNIKVVFVGDFNQLPSVGPGQLLKDFIESKQIETIYLDLLYRQSSDSYITTLAHEIKNGLISDNYLNSYNDYKFLECSSNSIIPNLKKLCTQIVEKGYDYKRLQIMAPMYAGINGIDNLNNVLQNIFNPKDDNKKELIVGDVIFRENDKILQLKNMPDENVFNGDIGVIVRIIPSSISESKKNEIYVDYDGNLVKYLPNDFNKIKHGFVISIHKSQGSEFEMVIMPLCKEYKRMLYKKLIYTGITRAKRKLILLGESDAFIYAVNNDNEYIRKTNLFNKLINNKNDFEKIG